MVKLRIPYQVHLDMQARAVELGFRSRSGQPLVTDYLRHLVALDLGQAENVRPPRQGIAIAAELAELAELAESYRRSLQLVVGRLRELEKASRGAPLQGGPSGPPEHRGA